MNRVLFDNMQDAVTVTPALRGLIKRSVTAALKHLGKTGDYEVSVCFTDNEGIRALNAQYRNIDRPTDVLSFPMSDDGEGDDGVLGDVVLSLEKCEVQAKEYGHSFERECSFLTVHSVLHLCGYDHETGEEDEKKMFALQDEIMKRIKIGE